MTWLRGLIAMFRFAGKHEADHKYLIDRICATEVAAIRERQRRDATEALLREEIEKWKSHRAWSDKIVRAYLDEIERKTAVLQ